ncbi:MAG TPA: type II secretion system protein [Pyrinomonadaceae bacterium]
MTQLNNPNHGEEGFSLLELLIGMTVTLVIMGLASTLLATSFNVRNREHSRTDAIADVQRALNIMSREIAIGGYGFDSADNGLVVGDCDSSTIRVRSNLNRYSNGSTTIESDGEDVKYLVDSTDNKDYLVRHNRVPDSQSTVLANRIDTLQIIYWSAANTEIDVDEDPSQVANAVGVRIILTANLPQVGTEGAPGFQPATPIQLISDVALRNKTENLATY